jgi:hypothetical protein
MQFQFTEPDFHNFKQVNPFLAIHVKFFRMEMKGQLLLTVSDAISDIQNATKQCISRSHLHTVIQFFHPSPYTVIEWA